MTGPPFPWDDQDPTGTGAAVALGCVMLVAGAILLVVTLVGWALWML